MATINAKLAANMWKLDIMLGMSPSKTYMYKVSSCRKMIEEFFCMIRVVKFDKRKGKKILPSEVRNCIINNPKYIDLIYNRIITTFNLQKSTLIIVFEKNINDELEFWENYYEDILVIKLPLK